MSLKGKEALHMYQIGIDIGGTNVKIGLLDEALELTAETSVPFPHTTEKDPRGSPCAAGREERGALRRRLARRGRPRQHRRERRDGS